MRPEVPRSRASGALASPPLGRASHRRYHEPRGVGAVTRPGADSLPGGHAGATGDPPANLTEQESDIPGLTTQIHPWTQGGKVDARAKTHKGQGDDKGKPNISLRK